MNCHSTENLIEPPRPGEHKETQRIFVITLKRKAKPNMDDIVSKQ